MKISDYIKSKIKKREITAEEWALVKEQAQTVKEFMTEPRFKFLLDFFTDNRAYILDIIARNGVKEVVETTVIGEITRALKTTKEEQLLEMSGKYKLIGEFLGYLETIKNRPDQYLAEQEKGFLSVADKEEG